MKEKDLKTLIRIVSLMSEKEWRSFKGYVNYKFEVKGKIEDTELTFETLKTFFINPTEEESRDARNSR